MNYNQQFNILCSQDTLLPATQGEPFVSGAGMEVLAHTLNLNTATLRDTITPMLYGRNRQLQGRITARIEKFCKIERIKCPSKARLEQLIEPYIIGRFEGLHARIDKTFLWVSGERGDHESCFFKGDWGPRFSLKELGAHSIYLVDQQQKALGRILIGWDAWHYPIFFNAYGTRLYDMALIVHQALGINAELQPTQIIQKDHMLYINSLGVLGYAPKVKLVEHETCSICELTTAHTHICSNCGKSSSDCRPYLHQGRPSYSKPLCPTCWGIENTLGCSTCGQDHPKNWPYCETLCPSCRKILVPRPGVVCAACSRRCPVCHFYNTELDETNQLICARCLTDSGARVDYVFYKRCYVVRKG